MDLRELIADYLDKAKLFQLATLDEKGEPWVCSMWFASDEQLNIYWFSSLTREHSKHIKADNHVAAAVALPQTPEDTPRGLQLSGMAEQLSDEQSIAKAKSVYIDRIFPKETVDNLIKNPRKPHHFYKLTPTKFVLFDALNFPEESRREYLINKHE